MKKEIYTVENVSRHLNSLPGIKIQDTTININSNFQLGTKTWGKIDFLKKNGFNVVLSDAVEANKRSKEDIEINTFTKKRKRKSTIDTIDSVKNIMKGINFKSRK